MIGGLLLALCLAPVIAIIGCLVARRPRVCEALNMIASALSLGCALPLPFLLDGAPKLFWGDYIMVDRMSSWVILCTAIVYFLASIHAVGYMRLQNEDDRL